MKWICHLNLLNTLYKYCSHINYVFLKHLLPFLLSCQWIFRMFQIRICLHINLLITNNIVQYKSWSMCIHNCKDHIFFMYFDFIFAVHTTLETSSNFFSNLVIASPDSCKGNNMVEVRYTVQFSWNSYTSYLHLHQFPL